VVTSRRLLIGIFALGFLLRAAELPLRGTIDVQTQKLWSYGASEDLGGVYGTGGDPPNRHLIKWLDLSGAVDYPPLALEQLALVGAVYRIFEPTFPDSGLLTILVKVTGLIFEVAFIVALLLWGPAVMGESAARWAAAAVWLNPAIWYTGTGLGYADAQGAMPAALALLAVLARRPVAAGVLIAVAVCTKPQTVFLVPVMALVLVGPEAPRRWFALVRTALAGAVTTVVIFLPFILRDAVPNVFNGVSRLLLHDSVSAQGSNLGWIATWVLRVIYAAPELGWHAALRLKIRILAASRVVELGYPSPKLVGTILVACALGWALWKASRGMSRAAAMAIAGWCVYAYAMFSAQVHENHLYPAIPLFALAAAEMPRLRPMYWVVSAIFTLNIYLFYGYGEFHPPLIDRGWTIIDMSVLLAVVNVAVFVWCTRLVRASLAGATVSPGPVEERPR